MQYLTPQAMLVVQELQSGSRLTDSFHVLQAQRVISNLQPPGVATLARIFAQYESLVPFVCILDDSLALVAKQPPISLQEFQRLFMRMRGAKCNDTFRKTTVSQWMSLIDDPFECSDGAFTDNILGLLGPAIADNKVPAKLTQQVQQILHDSHAAFNAVA